MLRTFKHQIIHHLFIYFANSSTVGFYCCVRWFGVSCFLPSHIQYSSSFSWWNSHTLNDTRKYLYFCSWMNWRMKVFRIHLYRVHTCERNHHILASCCKMFKVNIFRENANHFSSFQRKSHLKIESHLTASGVSLSRIEYRFKTVCSAQTLWKLVYDHERSILWIDFN